MSEATELITENEDTNKYVVASLAGSVWKVYKDYMKMVAGGVRTDPELADCTPEQREGVVAHINNYVMFKLYPKYRVACCYPTRRIFPAAPSEHDKSFFAKLQSMQWIPCEYFDVKREYYRDELCRLVVDGKIALE